MQLRRMRRHKTPLMFAVVTGIVTQLLTVTGQVPATAKPSFSRLYFSKAKRSVSSSIRTILFVTVLSAYLDSRYSGVKVA